MRNAVISDTCDDENFIDSNFKLDRLYLEKVFYETFSRTMFFLSLAYS